jgi:hypothetical protein
MPPVTRTGLMRCRAGPLKCWVQGVALFIRRIQLIKYVLFLVLCCPSEGTQQKE